MNAPVLSTVIVEAATRASTCPLSDMAKKCKTFLAKLQYIHRCRERSAIQPSGYPEHLLTFRVLPGIQVQNCQVYMPDQPASNVVQTGWLPGLLGWLQGQDTNSSSDVGLYQLAKLATAGHSRGGKIAALNDAGVPFQHINDVNCLSQLYQQLCMSLWSLQTKKGLVHVLSFPCFMALHLI